MKVGKRTIAFLAPQLRATNPPVWVKVFLTAEQMKSPPQEHRNREPASMSFARSALAAAAVLGMITSGVVLAQETKTPSSQETTAPSSTSSKVDDASKWTRKHWNEAKARWAKEKEKWADCRKQSKDQNLTGRKSWSFLASCMTS